MAFIFTRKSARPCIFIGLAASTFTIRGHTSATTASCSSSTTLKATSIASDALVNPLLKTNLLPLFNEINPTNAKEAIEIELKNLKENFEKYEYAIPLVFFLLLYYYYYYLGMCLRILSKVQHGEQKEVYHHHH